MIVEDIMTRGVVSVNSDASVSDAKALMKEHRVRRLPVIDEGKLVGLVAEDRLERASKPAAAHLVWQAIWLLSRSKIKDIMVTDVVTIGPENTVEQAVALAQTRNVGALLVVKDGKPIGIVTTNDIFYKVVNPTLGIGETGTRLTVPKCGDGPCIEAIIAAINRAEVGIKVIWMTTSPANSDREFTVHLDTKDADQADKAIKGLRELGHSPSVRQR